MNFNLTIYVQLGEGCLTEMYNEKSLMHPGCDALGFPGKQSCYEQDFMQAIAKFARSAQACDGSGSYAFRRRQSTALRNRCRLLPGLF